MKDIHLNNIIIKKLSKGYNYAEYSKKKSIKYFYFIMMLVNIKIRYGDYNPYLLFNICEKFNIYFDVFFNYINISHENLKKKDIITNFFLTKNASEESFELQLKNFISTNISNSKPINHSFLIDFININKSKLDDCQLNEYFSLIPLFKLNNIPENNIAFIDKIINDILEKKVYFLGFLIEDYKLLTDDKIEKIISLIKFISKYHYNQYKKLNENIYSYEFFFINKFLNEKDKYNIFINLNRLFNILKKINTSLFECLSDNFFFLGETISLFLFVYFKILKEFDPIKKMKKEIDFVLNEINEFIISFYKLYKDKEIAENITIYKCFEYFFNLLINNFYNKINLLNDKNMIYQEFDLLKEIVQFICDKNNNDNDSDNHHKTIRFYFFQRKDSEKKVKKNIDLRNKIMEIIIDKVPDKFIEVSEFFRKHNKNNNFASEIFLLIKKNSKITLNYISKIYLLINSSDFSQNEKYKLESFYKPYKSLNQLINIMNSYLIKTILFLSNSINNLGKEINISEKDIFRNKQFSIKLLDYSLPKQKMDYIVNKINVLYCEEKYEKLFLEIIKENITNKYVFDFILSNLLEEQIKQLFAENKAIIIKSLYAYSEINGYYFIQILLNNLEKCYPDKKFITNLIFPPKNKDEFNEMIQYFKKEKFFLIEIDNDNTEDLDKIEVEFLKDNQKFLFNYSETQNMVINYETKAYLFQYYQQSICIMNLYPELFYCFTKMDVSQFRPKITRKNNVEVKKEMMRQKKIYNYIYRIKTNPDNKKIFLFPYEININSEKSFYERESLSFFYYYKTFVQLNNYKNKELIKSLSPFYYKIYEFIDFMCVKSKNYIENLKSIESKIFRFYIIIFIFNKIPYKLKNLIYLLEKNNNLFHFDILIKEDILIDKSNITELEIFIILALLEIKGETIISIKEYFEQFYNKILNECNKYKELNIPEMDTRQPDDEQFFEGFKYLLNNDMNNFINKLKSNFGFYNLIFILEKKNNIINRENDSSDEYLEKIIYKLISNKENSFLTNIKNAYLSSNNYVKDCIFSLKDFTKNSLEILNESARDNKFDIILLFKNYNAYLLTLFSICNFILRKFINNNEFNLNLFDLTIFLQDYKDTFQQMKKTILLNDIKNHILFLYDNLILDEKDYFDVYIRNWIDDYLNTQYIKDTFSEIEKEKSSFKNYFKFLRINCIILYNFLRKIIYIDNISYKNLRTEAPQFFGSHNLFYNYIRNININIKINCSFKKQKDKEGSFENLKNSLMIITKEIIDYLEKNKEKIVGYCNEFKKHLSKYGYLNSKNIVEKKKIYIENKECINISYYYNSDIDDYTETCTNIDLYYFTKNKIHSIKAFICWIIYIWVLYRFNKLNIFREHMINRDNELITIHKEINKKNINYIITENWNHCKFNKKFFNIDNFFEKYKNMIALYFANTSLKISEPNAESCLYWIRAEMFKIFYNEIYPLLYFNHPI